VIEENFDIPFIASLALREKQIQQNYRPVIAVHKWFARRPGTLFRGLLLSEFGSGLLRESFYMPHNLKGLKIGDPFMGGGTPLLEANRIGCDVLGYDINPITIIVLLSILGFSPPEWAYVASQRSGVEIPQGFARSLDRKVRMRPTEPLKEQGVTHERFKLLVEAACQLLSERAPATDTTKLHRLAKADTQNGIASLRSLSGLGVPYAMLLYERFLGRPFAGRRDSVSELVGDNLESAIEDVLSGAGVSYRKTKRAERIPGFDQTPDFIIPSEFSPKVIIEAKVTEDDGTARDKVTRIQHLGELSLAGQPPDQPKFEVIACVAGRGFGVRREDMRKMLIATRGKVFTLKNINRLVDHTGIHAFRTK
jgi:hypothetical protein